MNRLIAIILLLGLAAPAAADLTRPRQEAERLWVYRLRVTPAAAPVPAFRHRLTTPPLELQPGNAASYYYRAILDVDNVMRAIKEAAPDNAFYDWLVLAETPLAELPLEEVRRVAGYYDGQILQSLATATRRRECDWGLNFEEVRGPETIAFLLPEFQESRQLARLLSLNTRLAVAEGRFEDALDSLRMTYRLGSDVARVPILVCSLLGIAEAGMANEGVLELIAAPGSPNLYWALAELPAPFFDLREALRLELALGLRIFPLLNEPESQQHGYDEWNRRYSKMVADLAEVTNDDNYFGRWAGGLPLAIAGYPHAKQSLIALGYPKKDVEAMPVGKVIAIYSARLYQVHAQAIEKAAYVPYWLATDIEGNAKQMQREGGPFSAEHDREILPVASELLPAVAAARQTSVRLDRAIAAMQIVEALRMHAAAHGKLPATLDQVTAVPVPLNPATNEPFEYSLDGETAVLTLPESDGIYGTWRYEITLADPQD